MVNRFFEFFRKKPIENIPHTVAPRVNFTTDELPSAFMQRRIEELWDITFKNALKPFEHEKPKGTMDSSGGNVNIKTAFQGGFVVPQNMVLWYASQTFIGYQLCAMFSQHWLISKCCSMPAEDAVRNGYEVIVNDGTEIDPEILSAVKEADLLYKLNENLIQFISMGRIFGIRVAMFVVESDDDQYYYKPFNPDGISPGSYRGISQIDPYWVTPQLDTQSAGNPAAINFYEPTWWNINGNLVHHTHLVIFRTQEVPDILKPVYLYGGVPVPQKIYERVYAAERTANEAPMLAMTKRLDVLKTDSAQALANQGDFEKRLQQWVYNRDNYGIKTIDHQYEDMLQFDTSLADLDAVIMTQYQIVAAQAEIPATRLLGTQPKGFNSTGEYEEASYHESLRSTQNTHLTKMVKQHHICVMRSLIVPRFGGDAIDLNIRWNPLDEMTAEEQANMNKLKAETGAVLANIGAIDGIDERQRIITDPNSGYSGLIDENAEPIEQKESDSEGA